MGTVLLRSLIALLAFLSVGELAIPSGYRVPRRSNPRADSVPLRLPNDTRPITYDIHLETRVDRGDLDFAGRVIIALEVLTATSDIVVHALQIEIKSVSLTTAFVNPETIAVTHKYDDVTEFLTITATDKTLAHGNYLLTIEYTGELRKDNAGFYLSTYTDNNNNVVNIATTQFESTDARHAFPCYDEPAKKAVFKITIKHGSTYTAISNMPVIEGPIDNGDGTSTTKFQQTTLMSTYLLAFIVSNFEYTELKGRVPHRIYSRPGTKNDQSFALQASVDLLEAIEDYLGYSYKLPKMDNVAVPDFAAGAMENWGLVTYREELMLYNDKESTTNTQNNIVEVIAHEFGHQFFGNLVSPYWWTFLWLNEGFATIFAIIAADAVFPEWDFWQRFHVGDFQRALASDTPLSSRPMTHYIETPNDISAIFDDVAYSKSGSVLIMIRHAITDEVFAKALNYYLHDMEYSSAQEDDLFRNFQKAIDEHKPFGNENVDIFPMFKSWTNQGGFPLIRVSRDYNKGTVTISQSPINGVFGNATIDRRTWWVPFNFATAKNPHYKETTMYGWLNVGEYSKEIAPNVLESWEKGDWVVFNKRATSYYRVIYDLENYKLLTAALIANPLQFHVHNRAQLLDDAFAHVQANRMKFSVFLDLSLYLKKENEYSPWVTANSFLTRINQYLSGDSNYDLFQYYVGKIVENFYAEVGISDKDDDEHLTKLSRSYAVNWACQANHGDCLEVTSNRLRDFIEAGKTVEPNMRSSIFCNGLTKAGEKEYNFMTKLLMDSKDQALRRLLMSNVMGCMQNSTLLEKYLVSSIQYDSSNNYKNQERIYVLPGVATKGPIQLGVVIDFLMANHVEYSKLPTDFGLTPPLVTALRSVASRVVNEEQNTKFEQLLTTLNGYSEVQGIREALRTTVKANLIWMEKYRIDLIDWLKKFKTTEEGGGNGGGDGDGAASIVASTTLIVLTFVSLKSLF